MFDLLSPAPSDLPPALKKEQLRVVLITMGMAIVTVLSVAGRPWSDGRTAVALSAVNCLLFGLHIVRFQDKAMARLLLFGLALGAVELIADALCVRFTNTLDYSVSRSAMLWLSPWWMPIAWMLVGTQIGYIGLRLIERWGVLRGAGLTALLGAVNIPFYEEMAYHAHWWQYQNAKMIGHTPLYIIAAEMLICFAVAPLARAAFHAKGPWQAGILGALAGISTILGGLAGYGTVERLL